VVGSPKRNSCIYKLTIQQSKHHYVALYLEDEYEELVLEAHFDVKCPDMPIGTLHQNTS